MNNVQNAKKQANAIIQDAIGQRVQELMKTRAFQELKEQVEHFENDPHCKGSTRSIDEMGFLESIMELRLDAFSEEDSEVIEELLRECSECMHFFQDQYSQGRHEWSMSQCLGDPVTVNFSDPRKCYAIHSRELGLKVNYSEVIGEDDSEKLHHAKLIIEQAMRKVGVFEYVVELDYYGGVMRELETLGTLEDAEIERQLQEIEAGREE